jgi:hypothetical protein
MTLTGGLSFSAGWSFTPPPPENTAGWFGGGDVGISSLVSTVDRITFATDTATASVRGPLSAINRQGAAAGNSDYAWFGAGLAPSVPSGGKSTVDRITYATDTATASVRGPLSSARYNLAATGNTTDGWFGGGYDGSPRATVNRITYATDTATASVRGPLSSAKTYLAAAGNDTDGWFGGGSPGPSSTVDRITYATDTATASVRGPLSASTRNLAAAGNSTDGWFGGGNVGFPSVSSTVQRITYATDTATASVRGPLSLARDLLAAAGGTQ